MCFADNPQRFFPYAEVIVSHFESSNRTDLRSHEILTGTVIEMVEAAEEFINSRLTKTISFEGWRRKEQLEMPLMVPREAIINAIMHRDYYDKSQSIQIDLTPEKISVKNPGGLPPGMTPEMFGKDSVRRNQIIARVLHRIGYVERVGSGISKMKKGMKKRGLPEPEFDWNSHFRVHLHRLEEESRALKIEADNLDYDQKQALKEAVETGQIDNQRFREITGVARRTATGKLRDMVEKGYLLKKGRTKGARYIPVGNEENGDGEGETKTIGEVLEQKKLEDIADSESD